MPVGRLLAIVIFCATSAFAQQLPLSSNPDLNPSSNQGSNPSSSEGSNRAPGDLFGNYFSPLAATQAEPWRIIPEQSEPTDSTKALLDQSSSNPAEKRASDMLNALKRLMADRHIDLNSQHPWVKVSPDGVMTWGIDGDCYLIRSYVVARDSKDSDTVHTVSESTCQPASRYGVHTADQRVKLSNGEDVR